MRILYLMLLCLPLITQAYDCPQCCRGSGGILYNDSSSGRFVCANGDFSHCYGTRHAIMNLQKLEGCCLWQGGVKKRDMKNRIVCRDGSFSEICGLYNEKPKLEVF